MESSTSGEGDAPSDSAHAPSKEKWVPKMMALVAGKQEGALNIAVPHTNAIAGHSKAADMPSAVAKEMGRVWFSADRAKSTCACVAAQPVQRL